MNRNPHQTLLVMVTGFLVLAYFFPGGSKYWTLAAVTVGLLGLVSGFTRKVVLTIWEKFSLLLGWINSRIILSLVFFVFLVPISFLYKLIKGDLLFLRKPAPGSLFVKRDHLYQARDLENPW